MPSIHDIPTGGRPPALEARDVSVFYGEKEAVKSVSLVVPANKVVALIGPSGCGKSTLLRILSTAIKPTRGEGLPQVRVPVRSQIEQEALFPDLVTQCLVAVGARRADRLDLHRRVPVGRGGNSA